MITVEELNPLLTVPEVARALLVDDTTVRRWIKENLIPCIELPRRDGGRRHSYRIPKSVLKDMGVIVSVPAPDEQHPQAS